MGKCDSSRTRVQPVFGALYERDTTAESWLHPLLEMAVREAGSEPRGIPTDLGRLEKPPQFELVANPPRAFLQWLIENPERLSRPRPAEWKKWSPRTQAKRQALLLGDAYVRAEALAQLQSHARLPQRPWWRFEGITRVDCALLTPSTVIFIEGKRTEMGPSKSVTWYPYRNQVLRVLDCASAFAQQTGRPHFFALLVVERDLVEGEDKRQMAIESITCAETVDRSLPHLSTGERAELLSHYLGVTTWQDIVERFHLGSQVLVHQVDC